MESDPSFPLSNQGLVLTKARTLAQRGGEQIKKKVLEVCEKADEEKKGVCERQKLVEGGRSIWGTELSDHVSSLALLQRLTLYALMIVLLGM